MIGSNTRILTVALALLCLGAAPAPPTPTSVPLEATGQGSAPLLDDIRRYNHQVTLLSPKIVDGDPAVAGDDKWQVALVNMQRRHDRVRTPYCGGVLVDANWVLTAGHCVDPPVNVNQFFVLAGTVDVGAGGTPIDVKTIWLAPGYVAGDDDTNRPPQNDLALLELKTPATGAEIQQIDLLSPAAESQALQPDSMARVTGWGAVKEGGDPQNLLLYVNLRIYSNDECNDPVAYDGRVTATMVCAGFWKGGKDSCDGDSGGPLTVRQAGAPALAGIVSWGEGCARRARLGVYTRVAAYASWILPCIHTHACDKASIVALAKAQKALQHAER